MSIAPELTSISQALAAIGEAVRALPVTKMRLSDALGCTLAAEVKTDIDYPPFDKAMMDGFAVQSSCCQADSSRLRIVGEVAAGAVAGSVVGAGEALRINTGAPVPAGADAVIMIENVEISPDGREIVTQARPKPGDHIARRGVDIRAGEVVLTAGTSLGPAQIAAAAAAGAATVRVHRRPRMSILVTGDELVDMTTAPSAGQIRNSNGPCLLALAAASHCEVVDLGTVGDDKAELAARIQEGLRADVLCITGGMSMGQHDYVPGLLREAGVRLEVQKIAIKPGKPTAFGVGPAGQLVFGLPGNPVSCFVCFLIFVRPALAGLQGHPVEMPSTIPAELELPLKPAGPRAEFIPARLRQVEPGRWQVAATAWQGSGDPFGLARSNGLMVRAAHAPVSPSGSIIPVVPLD